MIGVEKNANHKNLGIMEESPEIPLWERRHERSHKWGKQGVCVEERLPILEGDWFGVG